MSLADRSEGEFGATYAKGNEWRRLNVKLDYEIAMRFVLDYSC